MKSFYFLIGLIFGVIAMSSMLLISDNKYGVPIPYESIAIIDIQGEISYSSSSFSPAVTPEAVYEMIRESETNPNIKGILFRINSPGGSVVASRTIAIDVKNIIKPTVCWIGDVGASGAYWIASGCDKIISDPLGITGSIGVSASYLEFSGLFEKYGVGYQRILSGESKDTASPYKNATEKDREKLQYIVNETFKYFLQDVIETRNLTQEQVDIIKDGDVFLGKDSLDIGLVDQIGSFKDAMELIKAMANAQNPQFVSLRRDEIDLSQLVNKFF